MWQTRISYLSNEVDTNIILSAFINLINISNFSIVYAKELISYGYYVNEYKWVYKITNTTLHVTPFGMPFA